MILLKILVFCGWKMADFATSFMHLSRFMCKSSAKIIKFCNSVMKIKTVNSTALIYFNFYYTYVRQVCHCNLNKNHPEIPLCVHKRT